MGSYLLPHRVDTVNAAATIGWDGTKVRPMQVKKVSFLLQAIVLLKVRCDLK